LEPIRDWRINGIACAPGIRSPDGQAVAMLQVETLRNRYELGQNFDFLIAGRSLGENDADHLIEIEQPERELQIARIEHQRVVAETMRVLVVSIEQENQQLRLSAQHLLQEGGDPARL